MQTATSRRRSRADGGAIKLVPSILSADITRLGEQVAEAERAGADYIHVDVMDGHYVPNLTFGPLVVEALRRVTDLPLDVHLMVDEPESVVPWFAQSGASILTVHVEASTHLHRVVQVIKEAGLRAGVALNPATPVSAVEEALPEVDLVLVMTVSPGYSGQSFIPSVLPKIRRMQGAAGRAGLRGGAGGGRRHQRGNGAPGGRGGRAGARRGVCGVQRSHQRGGRPRGASSQRERRTRVERGEGATRGVPGLAASDRLVLRADAAGAGGDANTGALEGHRRALHVGKPAGGRSTLRVADVLAEPPDLSANLGNGPWGPSSLTGRRPSA